DWEDNFSKTRNDLHRHATSDWIIFLDGHEYVESYSDLQKALSLKTDALTVKIVMENGFAFHFPRIFRNYVKFIHKVHNAPKIRHSKPYDAFVIIHDREHGQSKKATKERASQRYNMVSNLMGNILKRNKKSPRPHFYLGNLNLSESNFKKAIKHFKKSAKYSTEPVAKWFSWFHVGISYNKINKPYRAMRAFLQAEQAQPNRWETAKMMGISFAAMDRPIDALRHFNDSFKINTGKFSLKPIERNDAETWDF
ncbi:unnamed protein product, partial [marine sediment metagenome]